MRKKKNNASLLDCHLSLVIVSILILEVLVWVARLRIGYIRSYVNLLSGFIFYFFLILFKWCWELKLWLYDSDLFFFNISVPILVCCQCVITHLKAMNSCPVTVRVPTTALFWWSTKSVGETAWHNSLNL